LVSAPSGAIIKNVVWAQGFLFGATGVCFWVVPGRVRARARDAGFRVPGYPWTVIAFVLAAVYVVIGSVASNPGYSLRGAALLALGLPVYRYWSLRTDRK
jgi:APA family basic amino acid/polyamine antiporter